MERARGVGANLNAKRSSPWLPEIDQILLVGLNTGVSEIREATKQGNRAAGRAHACRLLEAPSFLRENHKGNHPAPRNWPQEVKDLLREDTTKAAKRNARRSRHQRAVPGLPSHTPSRFARRQGWLKRTPSDHKTRS